MKAVYRSRLKAFKDYCINVGCNFESTPVEVVTNFLTILSGTLGLSYQSVCGYRSTLSRAHWGHRINLISKALTIKRLTRAVFIVDLPLSQYLDI